LGGGCDGRPVSVSLHLREEAARVAAGLSRPLRRIEAESIATRWMDQVVPENHLNLPENVCPHGQPVYAKIASRDELYMLLTNQGA
jgi:hypothetical protein